MPLAIRLVLLQSGLYLMDVDFGRFLDTTKTAVFWDLHRLIVVQKRFVQQRLKVTESLKNTEQLVYS